MDGRQEKGDVRRRDKWKKGKGRRERGGERGGERDEEER